MRNVQSLPNGSPATQPYNQGKPYGGGYSENQSNMAMTGYGQPFTPTPNYAPSAGVSNPHPVTPPMQYNQYGANNATSGGGNPFAEEEDFFGGPPMGSSVQGTNGFQESAMVPSPSNWNQYQGVINGMASLSVESSPAQSTEYQQPAFGGSDDMFQGPGNSPNWPAAQAQPQPQYQYQQHQQQYNPDNLNGNMWAETSPFSSGGNQLPDWTNHAQAPTASGSPQPVPAEANEQQEWSLDDHKSSVDLMRQQGAGLRALRLLDETTVNDHDPYGEEEMAEPTKRRGFRSLKKGLKKEMAKSQNAKQLRKMKQLEYKNKKTGMLAESSRAVTSVRRGYDPELSSDKCQLDFDRQRDSQLKALKLLNSNLF